MIGEAADGASAVALVERRRPDVVIMDLRMPDMDGLEATEKVLEQAPDTGVLIFTAYGERSLLQRGLESGARATSSRRRRTRRSFGNREGRAGETFVDPGLMAEFVSGTGPGGRPHSARRAEILQLLADGMSNADVAAEALHQPGRP